jgi:hypothetical protein
MDLMIEIERLPRGGIERARKTHPAGGQHTRESEGEEQTYAMLHHMV